MKIYGLRKLIAYILAMSLTTLLAFFNKVSDTSIRDIFLGVSGLYFAANVSQKYAEWRAKKEESKKLSIELQEVSK